MEALIQRLLPTGVPAILERLRVLKPGLKLCTAEDRLRADSFNRRSRAMDSAPLRGTPMWNSILPTNLLTPCMELIGYRGWEQ